jgi:hypothetical protein
MQRKDLIQKLARFIWGERMSEDTPRYFNRDADGYSEISDALRSHAESDRQHLVDVILEKRGALMDDDALTFTALSPFMPRPGDFMRTEKGQRCTVTEVYWGMKRVGSGSFVQLVPTVKVVVDV